MQSRSAVLLGATGLVGGFCLAELTRCGAYRRIQVVTRRALNLPDPAVKENVLPDLALISPADFQGIDDVFCALGTTIKQAGSQAAFRAVDYELPMIAARAAKQAGVKQLVLISSIGADPKSGNFYLRTKGELERDLTALGFDSLHIVRPGLLSGDRKEFRAGESIAQKAAPIINLLLIGPLRRYHSIPAATVGRAMVGAALQQKAGSYIHSYDGILALANF
jgi:uncharacterized protein YbjT (DUF2867 family)